MQFSQLIAEVESNIIDLPTAVQANVPTYINRALKLMMDLHNFNCMRMELGANNTLYTNPVTTSVPPASMTPHVIGSVSGPEGTGTLATNWKEPRENPYYMRAMGSDCEFVYAPNRQYAYREWDPQDPNSKGPPRGLLLSDPLDINNTRNLEVYPYSDSNSDWTTSPAGEYRVHVPYWGYLPLLVNPSDTNWFTVNADRFLIYAATSEGFLADWDEQRASVWGGRAMQDSYNAAGRLMIPSAYRQAIINDTSKSYAPVRTLTPRRDVFGPRDQWRT